MHTCIYIYIYMYQLPIVTYIPLGCAFLASGHRERHHHGTHSQDPGRSVAPWLHQRMIIENTKDG